MHSYINMYHIIIEAELKQIHKITFLILPL
jgi:hypothetical protein